VNHGYKAAAVTFMLVMAAGTASCARPVDHTRAPVRPAPLGSTGVAPGAPGVAWSKKSFEQRMEFMGLTFHPRMKELFEDYDGSAYGKFRCQTCHGEDMEARRFSMPAALRPLPAEHTVEASRARDAKATEFMITQVLPATKQLLSEGDPGMLVSCFSCHPSQHESED
jgi:hypothetical protein